MDNLTIKLKAVVSGRNKLLTLSQLTTASIIFSLPFVANAQWAMPIDTSDKVFEYAHYQHITNYMYHTGADLGGSADLEKTLVKAPANGRVVSVWGLAPGGAATEPNAECDDSDPDTVDGNEQIRLWDDKNKNQVVDDGELTNKADLTSAVLKTRLATCTGRFRSNHGLGIAFIIDHGNQEYSLSGHLSAIRKDIWDKVSRGVAVSVSQGDAIGLVGHSEKLTLDSPNWNAHLHFEVKRSNTLGSPTLDSGSDYWGYTPDIPSAYGYIDPKFKIVPPGAATPSVTAVKVIANEAGDDNRGVRVQSLPGANYDTLGWTGKDQRFFSDLQILSTEPGDNMVGRLWYRIHLPSRVKNYNNSEPLTGWIAASKTDGTVLVKEDDTATLVEVVNDEGIGWRLRKDPEKTCESSANPPACVSVWDRNAGIYRGVKVWNGARFVRRSSRNIAGVTWHEIDIPKFYFPDRASACAIGPDNDQCVGKIAQGWVREDAIRFVEEPISTNVDVSLIIDSSGSMLSNDPLNKRLQAAQAFLTASISGDYVGVVDFDSYARVASPLLPLPDAKDELVAAVNSIDSSGGTNIGAGVQTGCDILEGSTSSNDNRVAILLTDGVGTFSGEDACFSANGWPIYTFAMGSADRQLLQSIALNTGGEFRDLPTSDLVCEFQAVRAKIAGVEPGPCTTLVVFPFTTVTIYAPVAGSQAQVTFSTSWPGSDVVMTLISPSGKIIDRYTEIAGVTHDKGESFEVFTVANPESGEWEIQLYGADVPEQGEEVVLGVTTIPSQVRSVDIDVKPGDANNVVNTRANGVLPVAILTTASFDATHVDPATLLCAGSVAREKGRSGKQAVLEDVDGDGDMDLLVHFETNVLKLTRVDTSVILTGKTYDDEKIRGEDYVRVLK